MHCNGCCACKVIRTQLNRTGDLWQMIHGCIHGGYHLWPLQLQKSKRAKPQRWRTHAYVLTNQSPRAISQPAGAGHTHIRHSCSTDTVALYNPTNQAPSLQQHRHRIECPAHTRSPAHSGGTCHHPPSAPQPTAAAGRQAHQSTLGIAPNLSGKAPKAVHQSRRLPAHAPARLHL